MSDFLNGLLEKERLEKEHDEFWLDFESGYETYKAENDSRDYDAQFIQTYCQTFQVGYCEKFCDESSCLSWTDQAMICCSNCDRVCFDFEYTSYLVSCARGKRSDKTLLIASTVTLFSLPLVALLIYFCYHLYKQSPCYRPLSCRKPSFKCCDKNARVRVYLNRLRKSKKQNTAPPNCDDVYDKPYAFDDYEIPYAFEDYEIPYAIRSVNRTTSNHGDDGSIYEIYHTGMFPQTSSC